MTTTRTYGQSCPVAHALDLVGDRWALLVIRELRLGPRRFADLQAALPGIGPSVLTRRLRDLVANGVLERRTIPAPGRGEMYGLTAWGAELEPAFRALGRWGARSPVVPLRGPISDDSVMVGVRTFLSGTATRRPPAGRFLVRLAMDEYHLTIDSDPTIAGGPAVTVERGGRSMPGVPDDTVDAVLETDAATLQQVLVGRADDHTVAVIGDRRRARRLLGALHGAARTT